MATEYVTREEFEAHIKVFKNLVRKLKKKESDEKKLKIVNDGGELPVKKLSGFAIPSYVSPELEQFLGIGCGEKIARTEVTKKINQYVRDKGLQKTENKRAFVLDDELRKLIDVPVDTEVTFFNLQRFIKHHYIKAVTTEPVTTVTEPVTTVAEPVTTVTEPVKSVTQIKKVKKVKKEIHINK